METLDKVKTLVVKEVARTSVSMDKERCLGGEQNRISELREKVACRRGSQRKRSKKDGLHVRYRYRYTTYLI